METNSMLMRNHIVAKTSNQDNGLRNLLEISPCAMALWSRERSFCLFNESTRRLIHYSEADFLDRRSLWIERVHLDDQQHFSRFQEVLGADNSPVQCDYRFFPRSAPKPIWLREISALVTSGGENRWDIRSVYTDISDLKAMNAVETKDCDVADTIKFVSHELMNCFQKVIMELEIAKLGLNGNGSPTDLASTVDAMNRSVVSLRDQLALLVERFARLDPSAILDVTVQKLRKELHRQQVNLRLVRRGPLPMVRGDRAQLLSAFERVFEFCGALLKHGGNLEVQAGPKEIGGELYAEVKVISSSATVFDPDNAGTNESCQNSKGYQIGLGMALAADILGRYRGEVSFRKEGKNRGEVTILIKASPN